MRSRFLDFAHVLFGQPVPTFPGHALAAATAMIGWPAASPVDAADFYAGKTIDFIIGATTMRDKDFLADAQRARLDVVASTGERVQQLVEQLYAAPKATVERAKDLVKP
jgi:hypothetical protein